MAVALVIVDELTRRLLQLRRELGITLLLVEQSESAQAGRYRQMTA